MNAAQLGASMFTAPIGAGAGAAEKQEPYVRVAEIEIDPAAREAYQAAAREEIEASVRIEPGVLALYAVAKQDNLAQILVFEMYANAEAYQAHLETPHFRKYKATTQAMVKSVKLYDIVPIMLAAKAG